MPTSAEHYERLLAQNYTWIAGGCEVNEAAFAGFIATHRLRPSSRGAVAIDLGAGSGFQSIPLADVGYAVTAIDLSQPLLAELTTRATSTRHSIVTHLADLRAFTEFTPPSSAELIVCMGDTLTHLPSEADVVRLFTDAICALLPGGRLVLGFRDYTTAREGTNRFIPVRSEPDRIFTCFLDYAPAHVNVHDIVHRYIDGAWTMTVSHYPKLRLAPSRCAELLSAAGFVLDLQTVDLGVVRLIARRP